MYTLQCVWTVLSMPLFRMCEWINDFLNSNILLLKAFAVQHNIQAYFCVYSLSQVSESSEEPVQ